MGLVVLRCRIQKKQTRAALKRASARHKRPDQAPGTPCNHHCRRDPRGLALGLGPGVQIPGCRPQDCTGREELSGGCFTTLSLWFPLSLPNANHAAKLRRKLCPQCRERGGGQEPQRLGVPRRPQRKPQPSLPHLQAGRQEGRTAAPPVLGRPSSSFLQTCPGKTRPPVGRDCWSPGPVWLLSHGSSQASRHRGHCAICNPPEPQNTRRSCLPKAVFMTNPFVSPDSPF